MQIPQRGGANSIRNCKQIMYDNITVILKSKATKSGVTAIAYSPVAVEPRV